MISSVTAMIILPVFLLIMRPLFTVPDIDKNTCSYQEYTYLDNGKENIYQIDYKDRTVVAFLNNGKQTNTGIKQKVTPSQILKIKKVIKEHNGIGDPILPVLEGDHYMPQNHT